jgi:hypothetical protein
MARINQLVQECKCGQDDGLARLAPCSLLRSKITRIDGPTELWPMPALQLVVLALITAFPQFSLMLPQALGSR